jgi:AcrR family transcriptional regulator
MDIDPKSIYAAFGSKEELYLSALERYTATYDARSGAACRRTRRIGSAFAQFWKERPNI